MTPEPLLAPPFITAPYKRDMPAPQSSAHAAPSAAAPAAPGYIIAYVDVTRPEQYEEYRRWSSLAIETHGAQICVRGGQVAVLEGDWEPERVVVLKFSSFAAAQAFHDTPEYRKARQAREGAAIMRMICVEGV